MIAIGQTSTTSSRDIFSHLLYELFRVAVGFGCFNDCIFAFAIQYSYVLDQGVLLRLSGFKECRFSFLAVCFFRCKGGLLNSHCQRAATKSLDNYAPHVGVQISLRLIIQGKVFILKQHDCRLQICLQPDQVLLRFHIQLL